MIPPLLASFKYIDAAVAPYMIEVLVFFDDCPMELVAPCCDAYDAAYVLGHAGV